jgi:hypothetical protein
LPNQQCVGFDVEMAPKYHPAPLAGGDRKALKRQLAKSQSIP